MINQVLDYTEENGLIFCNKINSAKNNAEILYISEIKNLQAEAVLFRRFYRNQEEKPYHSEPTVCIFKEENIPFKSEKHTKLHASLWSAGQNEIYIIYGKKRINVINARKPSGVDNSGKPIIKDDLILADEAIDKFEKELFSAHLFGNGTFWEQSEYSTKLNEQNSPYFYLVNYLMSTRRQLLASESFKECPSTVDKLLTTSLLVKFLEEKGKDENGKCTLEEIYHKLGVENFVQAVRNNQCIEVFNELSNEFNGKIFDKFSIEEKSKIQNSDLTSLVNFLNPIVDVLTNQRFIWELYDFKYLPTEIISAIYENFIQAEEKRKNNEEDKGVVYTPIHLVNFLIDEVMPLSDAEKFKGGSYKILDPSCGSGVFLVAAFKRLLQWWAINNSKDDIQYPDSKTAQKILEENIYGVDTKEMATLVTVLGLTTALIDKLSPKEIWNDLKFKDLSQKNIQTKNFFEWAANAKKQGENFDLVIGNPPFIKENGVKKEEVLIPEFLKTIDFKHTKIPDNFALHFFEGSMALSKNVCMIIPSNVLLYRKSEIANQYREALFSDFTVSKIFDFTHLRRILFHKSADTPVVAMIAENKPSEKQPIEHIIIKRSLSTEKVTRFEIDEYDYHSVKWNWAIDETKQFVWKTNLLGGGRLFHLVYRLSLLPTLNDFIERKVNNEDWFEVRGYEGGEKIIIENQDKIIEIDNGNIPVIQKNTTIKSNNLKNAIVYIPPFLLIDQVINSKGLPSCFIPKNNSYTQNQYLYYNRDFIGIKAPEKDEHLLQDIFNLIKHNNRGIANSKFLIASKSSSSLINTEGDVNKSEILSLPYPENKDYLNLSFPEQVVQEDVLNYYIHLGKGIGKNDDGAVFHKRAKQNQLKDYGQVFCDTLNEIYAKNNKSWQMGKVYNTPKYIITQFGFGKNVGLKYEYFNELDLEIKNLIDNELSNKGASFKRIIRIYKHIDGFDCVFFVKPVALRYWFKSIALRDADDTYSDLKQAGY